MQYGSGKLSATALHYVDQNHGWGSRVESGFGLTVHRVDPHGGRPRLGAGIPTLGMAQGRIQGSIKCILPDDVYQYTEEIKSLTSREHFIVANIGSPFACITIAGPIEYDQDMAINFARWASLLDYKVSIHWKLITAYFAASCIVVGVLCGVFKYIQRSVFKHGVCVKCGYPTKMLAGTKCPECGELLPLWESVSGKVCGQAVQGRYRQKDNNGPGDPDCSDK